MYMKHPTVRPDGGKRPNDTPAWNYGYDPCPHCGATAFVETVQTTRRVRLEKDGTLHKKQRDSTLMEVWCEGCGEVLHRA